MCVRRRESKRGRVYGAGKVVLGAGVKVWNVIESNVAIVCGTIGSRVQLNEETFSVHIEYPIYDERPRACFQQRHCVIDTVLGHESIVLGMARRI